MDASVSRILHRSDQTAEDYFRWYSEHVEYLATRVGNMTPSRDSWDGDADCAGRLFILDAVDAKSALR
jgi:hypothetical protein